MKLSKKTIEALDRIGSVLRVDVDTFDEQAIDAAMESFFEDKEIVEDVAELLLQLCKKPEISIGFNVVLGFVQAGVSGDDNTDDTISNRVKRLVGSAMFSIAKEILKNEDDLTTEDEPV